MTKHFRKTSGGFLLIEVLVAVLIVAMGILGLAKLEAMVVGSAGEAKSRSAAMALARSQIESLRGSALKTQYTSDLASGTRTETINGISFTMTWTVSQPDSNYEDRLIRVAVSWIDRSGNTQTITLDSVVAWNDPVMEQFTGTSTSTNVIAPTGSAKRGTGSYAPGQTVSVETGSDNITRLKNANGETILYLEPDSDGQAQQFTIIYGRVYFDQTVNTNQLPSSANIYVRLSSEGECIYDHAAANLLSLPTGATGSSLKYKYFTYRCYVGTGWYGNVGVTVINDNTTPTVCVGDPKFTDTSFTATPTATESTIRSYRGFRLSGTTYISTGVASGSIYGDDGGITTKAGKPKPSDYTGVYGIALGSTSDFFHQDFLVTKVQGQMSCSGQMQQISNSDTFSPNAGKYYCINPDNWSTDSTGNQCPTNWFSTTSSSCSISVSGSFNPPVTPDSSATSISSVTCTMSDNSTCSCQTTSGTSNYSCSMTAGSSQTATITATMTSTGWSSAITQTCVPSSSCTAPSNTTSVEYQCTQSVCDSGYQRTQSRTLTWSAYTNVSSTQYNNLSQCNTARLSTYPDTSTTKYICTATGVGNKQVIQSSTVTYGSWTDTANTCLASSATQPTDTDTTKYTWLAGNGSNGCASGTQQLQAQSLSSTTTQTCTRTTAALTCSSQSSFNIDSSTSTCN